MAQYNINIRKRILCKVYAFCNTNKVFKWAILDCSVQMHAAFGGLSLILIPVLTLNAHSLT